MGGAGPRLHAIIPAGGAGTRLWPLSRRARPKFLLDLTGRGRSLLQSTVDRLRPLCASITIVTGTAYRDAVAEQVPEVGRDIPGRIVAEPSGRDSMAAIGLGAYLVRHAHGEDAIVGSFAADHAIERPDLLADAVRRAMVAAERGYVATVGITPDRPATGFGYIAPGEEIAPGVRAVTHFVEKPDAETAARYLAQGYCWNAGIFVVSTGTLARRLRELQPGIDSGLRAVVDAWEGPDHDAVAHAAWPTITRIPIDRAIAEPVAARGGVAVAPADPAIGWSDVGDFAALADLGAPSSSAVCVDAKGATVLGEDDGRVIAIVGIDDAVVVRTPDAILVTRREASQSVRDVGEALVRAGYARLR